MQNFYCWKVPGDAGGMSVYKKMIHISFAHVWDKNKTFVIFNKILLVNGNELKNSD